MAQVALLCAWLAAASVALAADPVASLSRDLSAQVAEVARPGSTIAVLPTQDRRGDLARHTARLRKLLLLELAGLEDVRILDVDRAPAAGLVLTTYLDTLGSSLVLSGLLALEEDALRDPVTLLAATEAGEVLALDRPEDRSFGFSVVAVGEVAGPIRASTAGDVTKDAGDELVLLSDTATHVLHLASYGFRTRLSRPHPSPEAAAGAPSRPSRDPRGGAVVLAPGRIWIRVPGAPTSAIVGPRVTGGMRRARVDWVPLGLTASGRILVGVLEHGTNSFERVGTVSGPDDREPVFNPALSPALEVVAGGDWVVTTAPNGTTRAFVGAQQEGAGSVGSFGSALAVLDLGLGSRPLVVGDLAGSGVLSAVALATGFGRELWQGAAPFEPCLLEAGDFDGDGGRELALIGCGDPAPLALLVPEGRP